MTIDRDDDHERLVTMLAASLASPGELSRDMLQRIRELLANVDGCTSLLNTVSLMRLGGPDGPVEAERLVDVSLDAPETLTDEILEFAVQDARRLMLLMSFLHPEHALDFSELLAGPG